ncbi:MAG: hypothetical protein IPL40_01405 [Proteobacteria bacterium]|nr:hypothetical protein [Pseudomonadota bacterium]
MTMLGSYRIANLHLSVAQTEQGGPEAAAIAGLPPAYAPFATASPARDPEITVLSASGLPEQPTPDPEGPRCETTQWMSYRSEDRPVFLFKSVHAALPIWRSAVREQATQRWRVRTAAEVRAVTGVEQDPHPLAFPLGELIFLDGLTEQGGLVFHSCGVRDQGRGMIFTGRSGRGKSTIGALWDAAGATVLCDDRIAVRRHPEGHRLYGTPWHGDLRQVRAEDGPLHAVFFLEHADRTQLERLTPDEARRRMLTTAWQPVWTGKPGLVATWERCARLAHEVPMYRLRFRPEPATIDLLRRELAALA